MTFRTIGDFITLTRKYLDISASNSLLLFKLFWLNDYAWFTKSEIRQTWKLNPSMMARYLVYIPTSMKLGLCKRRDVLRKAVYWWLMIVICCRLLFTFNLSFSPRDDGSFPLWLPFYDEWRITIEEQSLPLQFQNTNYRLIPPPQKLEAEVCENYETEKYYPVHIENILASKYRYSPNLVSKSRQRFAWRAIWSEYYKGLLSFYFSLVNVLRWVIKCSKLTRPWKILCWRTQTY